MNLEKERELFLYEIDGHGYIFENTRWLGNCFEDNFLNMAWELWLASANREAYKLVPVEPTEKMLDASRRRQWDDLSSPYEDMDMLKYKAMIGAIE